jgi:thiamine pyrophosphokinase
MSLFTILLNGPIHATPRLRNQIRGGRVIAADGGIVHAGVLGLDVELWVGDFDSTTPEIEAGHADVPRERYPVAKDRTDGDLASQAAIERGASALLFVGGLGGQSDHAFAHLALALRLTAAGTSTIVTTGEEEAYPLLPGIRHFDLPEGSRLSILALSDLNGLTLSGTRWPLLNADVKLGDTVTLSNVVTGKATVDLSGGYGIAIAYPAVSA